MVNMKKNRAIVNILSIALIMSMIFTQNVYAAVESYRVDYSAVKFSDFDRITELHIGEDDAAQFYDSNKNPLHNMLRLAYIEVDSSNEELSSYKGCLYNKERTMLVCYPQALKGTEIPRSCVDILPGALYGTSRSVRRQVKAIITRNNGGKWPGYYKYVNNAQDQERFSDEHSKLK